MQEIKNTLTLFYFSLLFSFFFEKDKFTEEYPELIAKRFTTKLGERVVRMLQAIFPSIPNGSKELGMSITLCASEW